MSDELAPPTARRVPTERTHHGDTFVDDYEWLRDKESPEAVAYLEAENAYTEAVHRAPGRRCASAIFAEIKLRTQETDLSVPVRMRRAGGTTAAPTRASSTAPAAGARSADPTTGPRPRSSRRGRSPVSRCCVDADELAEGHEFFSLGGLRSAPTGTCWPTAPTRSATSASLLRVKDLRTGELLPDEMPGTLGGATWDRRGTTLFYSTVDEAWRPDKVWRHVLGTPGRRRRGPPRDRRAVLGSASAGPAATGSCSSPRAPRSTTEVRRPRRRRPHRRVPVVAPRREGVEYSLEHAVISGEDCLLVLHNDGAENYTLADAPVDATSPEQWEPLSPTTRGPARGRRRVRRPPGGQPARRRARPSCGWCCSTTPRRRPGRGLPGRRSTSRCTPSAPAGTRTSTQPTVRLGYTTMADAAVGLRLRPRHRASSRCSSRRRCSATSTRTATCRHREWATAPRRRRRCRSRSSCRPAPRATGRAVLIYGYGSYEASIDPWFSIARLSLLDRGVGFAIAHVRGGGEMGRQWYDDGKLLHKTNTFTDFVACARHLGRDRLDVGGPAGRRGRQRRRPADGRGRQPRTRTRSPAVVAEVPFVDALTTILDPSLPLTVDRVGGVGQPARGPRGLRLHEVLLAVRERHRPALPGDPGETSINDTRVLYVEPAKWVAQLRATVSDPGGRTTSC